MRQIEISEVTGIDLLHRRLTRLEGNKLLGKKIIYSRKSMKDFFDRQLVCSGGQMLFSAIAAVIKRDFF